MDDTTLFGGPAGTGGAGGGGWAVARATARRFDLSVSFVIKLVQRWRRNGTVQPDRYGGWKRLALAAHAERVRALLAAEPDLTIAALRARLATAGIPASPAGISRQPESGTEADAMPASLHRPHDKMADPPGQRCRTRRRPIDKAPVP
jgi:hypothetical protein